MTIREACDLVITASSHALGASNSQVAVYVLDMGQPVKILDLADRLIRMAGLEPGRDIEIVFTGQRPGERLHEILFANDEAHAEIGIEGISAARLVCPSVESMRGWLQMLEKAMASEDRDAAFHVFGTAVPGFRSQAADL
jgi:O-antigen biosynthesis protein WbqV